MKNSELLEAVTHEIKNALNPVINLSSILLRDASGKLTDDENTYLEVIERNGKKILNIVEEFSFLNKLGKKRREHSYSSVSVREIIENAVKGMMTLSSYSGCELICDVEDESVSPVIDSDIFRRVIENVSLFFLSSGGGHPSLYFKTEMSGSNLMITASRGKTIFNRIESGPFDKNKIIEKGYSVSSVMWLNFASVYTRHLDGDVCFSSDDTGDAVFLFSIPSATVKMEQIEADTTPSEIENVPFSGREFVLLVIDDDIDNIIPVNAIIEHEFNGKGIVHHAESGGRALDILENIKPDIILLDLTLPDISGLSLVKTIKHLFVKKNIPVIAFTGMDIGNGEKMIRAGFDDVIKKPFNVDAFIHKIRKWID